jgi:hypothetical protein
MQLMGRADKAGTCCVIASRVMRLALSAPTLAETTMLLRIANDWLVLARRINAAQIKLTWRESGQRWLH